jgi:hypothetical protein
VHGGGGAGQSIGLLQKFSPGPQKRSCLEALEGGATLAGRIRGTDSRVIVTNDMNRRRRNFLMGQGGARDHRQWAEKTDQSREVRCRAGGTLVAGMHSGDSPDGRGTSPGHGVEATKDGKSFFVFLLK